MRGDHMQEAAFPFLRRRESILVIGVSSAVPSPPFMATGRVGDVQMERLARLLDRSGKERLFRVVAIHHPPARRPRRHFKRLIDAAKLRNVLARHGAELVIHGHDHVPSAVFLKGAFGRIPIIGVASASETGSAGSRPGYNLYRIDGEAGAYHCEMVERALSSDENTMAEVQRVQLA